MAELHTERMGSWRPWRGVYGRAAQLAKDGKLKKAGTASMPPHVVYVITEAGRASISSGDRG